MGKTIAIIAALDTKGEDVLFVKTLIEKRGHQPLLINVGVMGEPTVRPDIHAQQVAEAGGVSLEELRQKKDKALAMEVMTRGISKIIEQLYSEKKIDGVLSLGGSAGTAIGSAAMRALPIGFPKVMVSTVASGDTSAFVGTRDVNMFPSIVDVAGINRVSVRIYANAVGAIVGMVETLEPRIDEKPLVGASMFGNTTPAVNHAKSVIEKHGYEVLVFHATGTGGKTMENLVQEGYIEGVLDITTTELADELVGGVLTAGPHRLEAAGEKGIPQIIVPGCVDMVNFWAPETIPEKFKGRKFYQWNPNVTLMRTTPEENELIGKTLAEKANKAKGAVAFFLPLKGVSQLDSPGGKFWWPEADLALFDAIKKNLHANIPVYELDHNINDPEFAEAVAIKLLEFMGKA